MYVTYIANHTLCCITRLQGEMNQIILDAMSASSNIRGNIYSRYSSNSEAIASEFLEYLEEMFPCGMEFVVQNPSL